MSKQKNSLFYSQAELLNFNLRNLGIEVYEIVESKNHNYAIVNEINKAELEKLEKQGFPFYCIDPYPISNSFGLWIQFRNTFD